MIKLIVAAILALSVSAKAQTLTTINENLWTTGSWQYFDTANTGYTVLGGSLTVVSSVSASSFFGDGSHLTGVPSTGSIVGVYVPLAGGNMTGQLTTSSTITIQGNAFSVGGSTLVVSGGNVSIGPSPVPYTQLSISGSSSTAITDAGSSRFVGQLDIVSTASFTTQGGGCVTLGGNATSAGSTDTFVSLCGQKTSASSANDGGGLRVKVGQNASGNMTDALTVLNTGNVGIGTTSPATTLDVNGSETLELGTTGAVLCLTSSHVIGHCTSSAACTSTCTCTCTAN